MNKKERKLLKNWKFEIETERDKLLNDKTTSEMEIRAKGLYWKGQIDAINKILEKFD